MNLLPSTNVRDCGIFEGRLRNVPARIVQSILKDNSTDSATHAVPSSQAVRDFRFDLRSGHQALEILLECCSNMLASGE